MIYNYETAAKKYNSGSYYFNARWYDAGTGRFISEDPARDGSNWFIYTYNNPLKFTDPTGLAAYDDAPDMSLSDEDKEEIRAEREQNQNDDGENKKDAEKKPDELLEQSWGEFFADSMEEFVSTFDHYTDSYNTARNEGLIEGAKQFTGITNVGDAIETFDEIGIAIMGAGGVSFAGQVAAQLESATSCMGAKAGAKMTELGLKTPMKNAGAAQTPRYYNPETGRFATSELAESRKQDAYSSIGKFSRGVAEGYLDESTPTSESIAPEPRSRPQAAGQAVGRGIHQLQTIMKEIF